MPPPRQQSLYQSGVYCQGGSGAGGGGRAEGGGLEGAEAVLRLPVREQPQPRRVQRRLQPRLLRQLHHVVVGLGKEREVGVVGGAVPAEPGGPVPHSPAEGWPACSGTPQRGAAPPPGWRRTATRPGPHSSRPAPPRSRGCQRWLVPPAGRAQQSRAGSGGGGEGAGPPPTPGSPPAPACSCSSGPTLSSQRRMCWDSSVSWAYFWELAMNSSWGGTRGSARNRKGGSRGAPWPSCCPTSCPAWGWAPHRRHLPRSCAPAPRSPVSPGHGGSLWDSGVSPAMTGDTPQRRGDRTEHPKGSCRGEGTCPLTQDSFPQLLRALGWEIIVLLQIICGAGRPGSVPPPGLSQPPWGLAASKGPPRAPSWGTEGIRGGHLPAPSSQSAPRSSSGTSSSSQSSSP